MKIEYNGVTLEMTELTECTREAVYDPSGTDLLYVKWRVGVVATLASGGRPNATAADFATSPTWAATLAELTGAGMNVNRGTPPALGKDATEYDWDTIRAAAADPTNIANPAFTTDVELRNRLLVPRRKLKITAYHPNGSEYVWLESPRPWIPDVVQRSGGIPFEDDAQDVEGVVDAANGPKPLRCDVVQPAGEGASMGAHFVIETCVVPVDPAAERLVLSHRWETTMSHDDDHYLTRTTVGEIIFDAQILHAARAQPDWFRGQFFHPIPLGFRRGGPVVRQSNDGLTLQYEIHDTDPTVVFDPGDSGATSMNIVETHALDNRGVFVGHLINGIKKMVLGEVKLSDLAGPIGGGILRMFGR